MLSKKQSLYLILAAFFITNALLAEIIGVKIFSLEGSMGIEPFAADIFGYVLNFDLSAGVILWPFVFITTDIINEYFGRPGVKQISYVTVACIIFAFFIVYVVRGLAPADFWVAIGNQDNFDINFAFNRLFSQSLGIIVGSLVAFLVGQFLDVFIFQKIKKFTGEKMIWLRATGSTLISQLIDSFVVLAIAFYIMAPKGQQWELSQVASVGTLNYIYKFLIAIALTPVIYLAHNLIDRYLGDEEADKMKAEATANS